MTDQQLGPLLESWLKATDLPPSDVGRSTAEIEARLAGTPQRDRWWPPLSLERLRGASADRTLPRGFTMFSALKVVAAGVIVALFGGFLLAGVLTTQQDGEAPPAAQTESPAPMTTGELLSGMVTEEVEPGVYKVVNDGVRDLAKANNTSIVAGHDGGIWLLRPQRFFRFGDDELQTWATKKPEVAAFEVAPDGTVWAMLDPSDEGGRLYSVGRGSDEWTLTTARPFRFEVTSDGTVRALWGDDPEDPESLVFGYLGADGWQAVGEWPDWHPARGWCLKLGPCAFLVSDRGEVWAVPGGPGVVQHFVDGAWRTYDEADDLRGSIRNAAVGADGTLWGSTRAGFFRFDGTEWTAFEWHDGFPGSVFGWGDFHVADDGALWVAPRPGECEGRDRCSCHHGVARFDGTSWDRYLPDLCVKASDITADGAVWLLAGEEMLTAYDEDQQAWGITDNTMWDLYVITPEAVAGAEPGLVSSRPAQSG